MGIFRKRNFFKKGQLIFRFPNCRFLGLKPLPEKNDEEILGFFITHINTFFSLNIYRKQDYCALRRLQAQTLSDASQQIGKIHPFRKIAVNLMPLRFKSPKNSEIVYFMTEGNISNHLGLAVS